MTEEKSYRQAFKAIGIFGGVQVVVIILGILRNKIVAITMGPNGIGELGLYTTAITFILAITSLGIGSSAVKAISEYYYQQDTNSLKKNIYVFNRLTIYTGLSGLILTCILSPFLSKLTFGNYSYIGSFALISIAVIFFAIDTKQLVLLQSTRNLKGLGKASAVGAIIGTIIVVPLYLYFKEKAIVASLLILYLSNMASSYYYSRKLKLGGEKVPRSEFNKITRNFVSLGLAMTISSILVYAVSYIVRLYILKIGGIKEVGLYQAGWAIINGYVGLVFTAMAKDYFPRLAAVNSDNDVMSISANQQMEIGLFILVPIIVVFIIAIDPVIHILYSTEFFSIKSMMIWSFLGMLFKLLSWCISYMFLAKGLARQFIIYEVLNNILTIILTVVFYDLLGLEGLGVAFFLGNLFYLLIVFFMARFSFKFSFSKQLTTPFLINFFLCTLIALIARFKTNSTNVSSFAVLILLGMIVTFISLKGLNKRLNIL